MSTFRPSSVLASLVLLAGVVPGAGPAAAVDDGCAAPTIIGTAADDVLVGTAGPDVIAGLGGADRIDGLAGDDVLCGGDDDDVLSGGPGDDRLYGGADLDLGAAVDGVHAFVGGDSLSGGPGDDLLDGGADPRHRGHDRLDYADAAGPVTVDLAARTATGEGVDVLGDSFNVVVGSAYDDRLLGTELGDVLVGLTGADRLVGRAGDDGLYPAFDPADRGRHADPSRNVVAGGPGADEVFGGSGAELIRGGADDDTLSGRGGADRILGGTGDDGLFDDLPPGALTVLDPGGQRGDYVVLRAVRGDGRRAARAQVTGRIDLAHGRLRGVVDDRALRARLRHVHDLVTPQGVGWTVLGTPGSDSLAAHDGRGVRLLGRGGSDVLRGTPYADLLDGGPGTDRGLGNGGRDVLRGFEPRT